MTGRFAHTHSSCIRAVALATVTSLLINTPLLAAGGPDAGAMPSASQPSGPDLSVMSLEDLLNVRVYAAARKEQVAIEATSAVFVITQDDIRRSGVTAVPELLRMVPGVQVAHIDSDNWAVAVRGFNQAFSNKLLVLVDGRSVYNRLWSGVNWKAHDLMLDNIERVEVIRGPGGAVWGANAVNGVINIVTKNAAGTKGGFASVEAGGPGHARGAVRYGGELGRTSYRVYSQWTAQRNDVLDGEGLGVFADRWSTVTNGTRLDRETSHDALTLDGALTQGSYLQHGVYLRTPDPSSLGSLDGRDESIWQGHLLGRWTRSLEDGSVFTLQSYTDLHRSTEWALKHFRRLIDTEARYQTRIGRHDLVSGIGWRTGHETLDGAYALDMDPRAESYTIFSLFAQDEISVAADRVRLTVGSKFERDTISGWGVQPTARALWRAVPDRHHVWAAGSRALRTPSISDRYLRAHAPGGTALGLPVVVGLYGNPDFETEELGSFEAGYRWNISAGAAVDVAAFYNRYDHLPAFVALPPVVQAAPQPMHVLAVFQPRSTMNAQARGVEVMAQWRPAPSWRLDAGYTTFGFSSEVEPGTGEVYGAAGYDAMAPRHQWHGRSSWTIAPRVQLDATVYRVGLLRQLQVPGYTRADLRAETKLSPRVSLAVAAQDVLNSHHVEYDGGLASPVYMRRAAHAELRFGF